MQDDVAMLQSKSVSAVHIFLRLFWAWSNIYIVTIFRFLFFSLFIEHVQSFLLGSTNFLSFYQPKVVLRLILHPFALERWVEYGHFVILQLFFSFFFSATSVRSSFVLSVPSLKMTTFTGSENEQISLPWIFEIRRRSSGVAQVSCGQSADFAHITTNFAVFRFIRRYSREFDCVYAGQVREYCYHGEVLWHVEVGQLHRSWHDAYIQWRCDLCLRSTSMGLGKRSR